MVSWFAHMLMLNAAIVTPIHMYSYPLRIAAYQTLNSGYISVRPALAFTILYLISLPQDSYPRRIPEIRNSGDVAPAACLPR
jgi:hypothetical protein